MLPEETTQFKPNCLEEIAKWFPDPVIRKLNWLLRCIRSVSEGVTRDFLEVILSSFIREISQQDPNDLRIRRRKNPIQDADVFPRYLDALETQYTRIERFWSARGYSPNRFFSCKVVEGDSRNPETLEALGLAKGSMDRVLTSPPLCHSAALHRHR